MVCKSIREFNIGLLRLKYADWNWSLLPVSSMAKDFIEKLGNEYPEKRISVTQALQHPFITRAVTIGLKPLEISPHQMESEPEISKLRIPVEATSSINDSSTNATISQDTTHANSKGVKSKGKNRKNNVYASRSQHPSETKLDEDEEDEEEEIKNTISGEDGLKAVLKLLT